MVAHPLVDQLRCSCHEWERGLAGAAAEDAVRHFCRMNCISWTVGHLAWHDQRSWLQRPQDRVLFPVLNEWFVYGAPMSSAALTKMLRMWQTGRQAADPYLDSLTTAQLHTEMPLNGKVIGQTVGSLLRRVT